MEMQTPGHAKSNRVDVMEKNSNDQYLNVCLIKLRSASVVLSIPDSIKVRSLQV